MIIVAKDYSKQMVPYVELPKFEEYKEWFKNYADLTREDGILQVAIRTGDHKAYWSGGMHRAMGQLSRVISMDHENEVVIWTSATENWIQDQDPNGWDRYADERFEHQYYDDMNLIKNMVFDLDVPTIGAMTGPGFHWDAPCLCDITIVSEDVYFDDPHLSSGMVSGDGMGLLLQQLVGLKHANYLILTGGQIDAKTAYDWGMVSEIAPKGKVLERAWECARIIKSAPYHARCVASALCKRPMQRALMNDLRVNTLSEAYSTQISLNYGNYGGTEDDQVDERFSGIWWRWRCSKDSDEELLNPRTYAGKKHDRVTAVEWFKNTYPEEYAELAKDLDGEHDYK
jgi:enoyl-CoA hydratase/carnithine racemase